MQKVKLIVSDMHCANCVMRLEGIEDELDGVVSASASYQKQSMEVEFDEQRVSLDAILAEIEHRGYSAVVR